MLEILTEFYSEDPKSSPDFARIINRNHTTRLQSYLDEIKNTDGFQILRGGEIDLDSCYLAPTLIDVQTEDVSQCKLMTDEIFGPLLPILCVKSIEQAVEFVNDRPRPLALYMFSKNSKNVDHVLESTTSGGAVINDTLMHFTTASLPFGGVGDSGIGGMYIIHHHRTSEKDDHDGRSS